MPFLLVKIQEDEKKERLINRMLLRAYDSRLPVNQQWMDQAEIRITYRSERYLCFEYISHAALPDGYDDTQLVFTVDLQEQNLIDYPEIETEWRRYDKFMNGSLYKEMEQWLEKPVEEASKNFGDGIADIGITVNIKTGERFMLDDFLEVERFSNWLWANACRAGIMRTDHLLGSIMTEQELAERYDDEIVGITVNSYRCDLWSFYIYQGKIVLMNGSSAFDVEIPLPEVYEWLKTDPWYD